MHPSVQSELELSTKGATFPSGSRDYTKRGCCRDAHPFMKHAFVSHDVWFDLRDEAGPKRGGRGWGGEKTGPPPRFFCSLRFFFLPKATLWWTLVSPSPRRPAHKKGLAGSPFSTAAP